MPRTFLQSWLCATLVPRKRPGGEHKSYFSVPQINPHNKWAQLWDSFAALTLLYVALAVPFEVAFIEDDVLSANWFVGRIIDLVRILEKVVQGSISCAKCALLLKP